MRHFRLGLFYFFIVIEVMGCKASDFTRSGGGSGDDNSDDNPTRPADPPGGGDNPGDSGNPPNEVDVTDGSNPADICDVPSGQTRRHLKIFGEDVPGNGLLGGADQGHAFGSDFDDYFLTVDGDLIVETNDRLRNRIGVNHPTTLNLTYQRGTTDCQHNFAFIFRKCPNQNSTELGRHEFNVGRRESGQTSFQVPHANVFIDIQLIVSASFTSEHGSCLLPFPKTNQLYQSGSPGFRF